MTPTTPMALNEVLAVMDAEISALREGIARGDELIRADMPRRERVQVVEIRAALAARLARAEQARATIAALQSAHAEVVAGLRLNAESLKGAVYDEMAANLKFREDGGAHPDEDMPTFCARVLAERSDYKQRAESAEARLARVAGLAHVAPLLLDLATTGECDTLMHTEVADLRALAAAIAPQEGATRQNGEGCVFVDRAEVGVTVTAPPAVAPQEGE